MPGELVFTVESSTATPATPISLADAGLKERSDLQEWVIAHPEILGTGVKVVAFEFDRWQGTASGERERDRLDVLGLDTDGRLVVAELKRDRAPSTVHLQAVSYAAMASRFTEDALVEHYLAFRHRSDPTLEEDAARAELADHAGELDPDALRRPRIVLVAGEYPPTVTASVVWLTEMGLDITIQRVQAYRVFEQRTIVSVSQLFPVPDVEAFTVSPQRAQAQAAEDKRRQVREKSTVVKLATTGAIPDGTLLTLRPTAEVDEGVRQQLLDWVAQEPSRGRARWHNRRRDPLKWEHDGLTYRPTPLVTSMLHAAAGITRGVRGPSWWVLPDGRDLPTVAGSLGTGRFDWTPLHEVMASIPAGRWTTYGDLAKVIGTSAQPLGQHIASCPDCPNAQRVLGGDGRVRPNFAWTDSRDRRAPEEALRAEGLRIRDGVADTGQRMSQQELAALTDA